MHREITIELPEDAGAAEAERIKRKVDLYVAALVSEGQSG